MSTITRKETRSVKVGSLLIGGGAPIVIQSMTNSKTTDFEATMAQIENLVSAGCDLVRVAVPDHEAAIVLKQLVKHSPVPLVADIHFDPRLAALALDSGAAKIRINPGNLGGVEHLRTLARIAGQQGAAIRIGVNAGSLDRKVREKYGGATAVALVESARTYLSVTKEMDFHDLVVSLKASDVMTTIEACRLFSELEDYPLHLGVTEAGPPERGMVKAAIGIGTLLAEGIGDTIRVSLTADPVEEVKVARQILQALGLGQFGPELISCPTCGRCQVNLVEITEAVEELLKGYTKPLKVAVMGCAVNGPGEAREADLGISAGKQKGILFRHGEVIKTVAIDSILEALKEELDREMAVENDDSLKG